MIEVQNLRVEDLLLTFSLSLADRRPSQSFFLVNPVTIKELMSKVKVRGNLFAIGHIATQLVF